MKAEELFVGALVHVNCDGLCIKKDTIVEVRGVDADDRLAEKGLVGGAHCRPLDDDQFEGGIWCEYLDPIPITPEIMEKNGFRYRENDTLFELHHFYLGEPQFCKNMNLHIGNKKDMFWIDYNGNHIGGILYVHELQHALRILRIEKEIEL